LNGAIEAKDVYEAGAGRNDVLRILRQRVVQDFEAAHHFGAFLKVRFGGGGD